MKRKKFMLAITLLFLLSILLAGCSETAGAVPETTEGQSVEPSVDEEEVTPEAEEALVDSQTCQAIKLPDSFTLKEPQDIVVGYVKRFEWKPQQTADFQQACNELSIQCVYGDDIFQLIDQGVSAIVQDADYISVEGITGDIDRAWQSGVPVFVLNAAPSGMVHAYTIAIDYNQWAAISLEWMAENMDGQGEMILVYPGENPPYMEAIEEFFVKYPDIVVVEQKTGMYNAHDELQPDVVNFINTYPDLKAIWTTEQMDRVYWGLRDAGIAAEDYPLLVTGANTEGLDMWVFKVEEDPNFESIAVIDPSGVAYDAVYAAYYLLSGYSINDAALGGENCTTLSVPIPVVTSDNLEEWWAAYESQGVSYDIWLDEFMTPEMILEQWFLEK